jgi:hypothetical protein
MRHEQRDAAVRISDFMFLCSATLTQIVMRSTKVFAGRKMYSKLHRAETDRYGGNAVTECQGLRPIRIMSCRGEVKMGCHYLSIQFHFPKRVAASQS